MPRGMQVPGIPMTTISPYPGTPVLLSGEVKGIRCEDGETNFELLHSILRYRSKQK